MRVWHGLEEVPAGFGPCVVTLGNFDGVHRGHQEVLGRVVEHARAGGLSSVAVTFDPHPSSVHRPQSAPELLTGLGDRIELMGAVGLDAVLVLPYSLDFARQGPEQFVERYLAAPLTPRRVVVGGDVRFGWQNSGDLETMTALGRRFGFEVEAVPDLGGRDRSRWSSSLIRDELAAGRVREAALALGREHFVQGEVVHGDARGRELGFPTANLGGIVGMVPADGVYAGRLSVLGGGETDLPAAVSIGTNPTFDGVGRRVEAYVLDRTDLDLYGDRVRVTFVDLLRPTLRFDSVDELVEQMGIDVDRARQVLSGSGGGTGQ